MFMQLYNHLNGPARLSAGALLLRLLRHCRLAPRRLSSRLDDGNRHPAAQLSHVGIQYGRSRAVIHELTVASRFHETRACQLLQMVRDRCLSDRKTAAQPAATNLGL